MLKTCRSPNITEYYGSAVVPGTSQLMIVMELMAASVADLVRRGAARIVGRPGSALCGNALEAHCAVGRPGSTWPFRMHGNALP